MALACNSFCLPCRSQNWYAAICPCSIVVWLYIRCSGTHQRSLLWPLGNKGFGFVSDGNVMAARVALLCLYSAAQGCRFLVEQPAGSSAPIHPRLVQLFNSMEAANLCFFKVCLVNVFFRRSIPAASGEDYMPLTTKRQLRKGISFSPMMRNC